MEDLVVRPYQPGDDKGIVEVLRAAFEGWPFYDLDCTPVERWQWLYLDNPRKNLAVVVAELNGRIIGTGHSVPLLIKVRDKILSGYYGTDSAVHPEFQGKGVSSTLRPLRDELRKKRIVPKVSYGCTVNPIILKRRIRVRTPIFPYDILVLAKIYDIGLHIRMTGIKNKWRMRAKHYANKLFNAFNQSTTFNKQASEVEISDIKYFDERLDKFWNRVRDNYDFIVERTRDYLNWRYGDLRGGNYRVRLAADKEQVLGFSVLRINRLKEYPEGYIVDFLALPERLDIARLLADDAVARLHEEGVNVVRYQVIKGHPYETIFKKQGFNENKDNRQFSFRWMSEEPDETTGLNPSRIHFVYGDITGI